MLSDFFVQNSRILNWCLMILCFNLVYNSMSDRNYYGCFPKLYFWNAWRCFCTGKEKKRRNINDKAPGKGYLFWRFCTRDVHWDLHNIFSRTFILFPIENWIVFSASKFIHQIFNHSGAQENVSWLLQLCCRNPVYIHQVYCYFKVGKAKNIYMSFVYCCAGSWCLLRR